jgi:hypothetical protein
VSNRQTCPAGLRSGETFWKAITSGPKISEGWLDVFASKQQHGAVALRLGQREIDNDCLRIGRDVVSTRDLNWQLVSRITAFMGWTYSGVVFNLTKSGRGLDLTPRGASLLCESHTQV